MNSLCTSVIYVFHKNKTFMNLYYFTMNDNDHTTTQAYENYKLANKNLQLTI